MSDQEQPQAAPAAGRSVAAPSERRPGARIGADRAPSGVGRAASLRRDPRCASSASRRRRRSITRRPSSCAALSAIAARSARAARPAPVRAISATWRWPSSARDIWPCCLSSATRPARSQPSDLTPNWSTGCSSTACSAAGMSAPLDQFPYRSRTYVEEQNKSPGSSAQ